MTRSFILSDYVDHALDEAVYEKLEDGSYAGRIPSCEGVIAFGLTLRECEIELRSVLEEWVWLGLKLGHPLPILGGINLNQQPVCEPVGAL